MVEVRCTFSRRRELIVKDKENNVIGKFRPDHRGYFKCTEEQAARLPAVGFQRVDTDK